MVLVLCIGDLHVPHRAPDLPAKFRALLVPGKIQKALCPGNLCNEASAGEGGGKGGREGGGGRGRGALRPAARASTHPQRSPPFDQATYEYLRSICSEVVVTQGEFDESTKWPDSEVGAALSYARTHARTHARSLARPARCPPPHSL